jgi:hypothetical protein
MAKKFDPAPVDKHTANPNEAANADREMHQKADQQHQKLSFWQKIAAMFK